MRAIQSLSPRTRIVSLQRPFWERPFFSCHKFFTFGDRNGTVCVNKSHNGSWCEFVKVFFVVSHISRISICFATLEKLHWLRLGEMANVRQDKRKLHVLDSLTPPLQNLLSSSLPNRTYRWAYAEVMTKISRMDSFPIFS